MPKLASLFLIALLAVLPLAAEDEGFESLFDGTSLDGWVLLGQHGHGYLVEDGKIVCPRGSGGNLLSASEYSDFVLRFEFKAGGGLEQRPVHSLPTGLARSGLRRQRTADHRQHGRTLQGHQAVAETRVALPCRPCEDRRPQTGWRMEHAGSDGRRNENPGRAQRHHHSRHRHARREGPVDSGPTSRTAAEVRSYRLSGPQRTGGIPEHPHQAALRPCHGSWS